MVQKVAIITPTYNEAKNIEKLISALSKVCTKLSDTSFTLFVVDDLSPDRTADVAEKAAKKYASKNFKIEVLRRKGKRGFGNAYIYGFKQVLKKGGFNYVIQMDADLSHNPKYIGDFTKRASEGHDYIVASRYVSGGATPDWGLIRKIQSRGGNAYAKLILGRAITDYTGGFNMYSTKLLKELDTDSLSAGGYGFLIELKYRAMQIAKPVQIPIVFHDRKHGKSKLPKSTILKNFILVVKLRSEN